MILNINDQQFYELPSIETVHTQLQQVQEDDYAILAQANEHYIQCYCEGDDDFLLEYREGSSTNHFSVNSDSVSRLSVVIAFTNYLSGEEWKSAYQWIQMDFDGPNESSVEDDGTYLICGVMYTKIMVGEEHAFILTSDGKCPECQRETGEYHHAECSLEECPRCHEPMLDCECDCEIDSDIDRDLDIDS